MTNAHTVATFAERLEKLTSDHKADLDTLKEQAEKAGIDFGGIKRLVSWQRKDHVKRAEQEAIDHQYRFLAGEVDEPAALPTEGHLSQAIRLYADKLTVRQVAKVLEVSVGKAQKLRTLAALFNVHDSVNVNTPPHDPETGEIEEVASIGADAGRPSEPSVPAEQSVSSVSPPGRVSPSSTGGEETQSGTSSDESCGGVESRHAAIAGEPSGLIDNATWCDARAGVAPGPQDTNADDLAIPSFLRRNKEAVI